jgi:hypothetical protein
LLLSNVLVRAQEPTPTPTPRVKTESQQEREIREQRQDTEDGRFNPTGATTHGGDDHRYRIEVGVLPRFNSNLFEAEDDAVKRSSFITTLSARAEYDFVKNDRRTITGSGQIRYNIFTDVKNANSVDVDLAMRVLSGKNDFQTTFFITPERLAFITGDGLFVHNSVTGFNLDYTRRFGKNFRVRGGYQFSNESYEGSLFDDRDNTRHRLSADVRYRIHSLFQPGIGIEYDRVNAQSENFTRNGIAPVLLLVSSYKNIVYTSARYRYITRDYVTVNPLDPNFDRTDFRHDFSIYSSIRVARQWRIYGFISALENNSGRIGRSFTGYQTGLGAFFTFP